MIKKIVCVLAVMIGFFISASTLSSAAIFSFTDNQVEENLIYDIDQNGAFDFWDISLLQNWFLEDDIALGLDSNSIDFNDDGKLDIIDFCIVKSSLLEKNNSEVDKSIIPPIKALEPTLPSTGTNKILVFAVDFTDLSFNDEIIPAELNDLYFSSEKSDDSSYPHESVSAYYQRASYDKMFLTGDVFKYTAQHPISWYAKDDAQSLVSEIVNAFDKQLNYQEYDIDDDNVLDAVSIIIPDEANVIDNNSDNIPDWWPYSILSVDSKQYDGISIGTFCVIAHNSNDRTDFVSKVAHELGHAMGLPDYYKYTDDFTVDNEGLIGQAGNELMDEGLGDFSVCSKLLLGWLDKDEIKIYSGGKQTYYLTSMQYSPVCIMIPRDIKKGFLSEYFLIEYITNESNNTSSSGNGVRIFHVNSEVTKVNSGFQFKYGNNGEYYDKSNQRERVLRLVNDYGFLYPGKKGLWYKNIINNDTEDFRWYDNEGKLTISTDITIEIEALEPGPYFDYSKINRLSAQDYTQDPLYIKGSKYKITVE